MLDRGRVGKVYVFGLRAGVGSVQAAVESYAGLGAFIYERFPLRLRFAPPCVVHWLRGPQA